MRVILANKAGYCFGVQRAVDTVYREVAGGRGPVYTYGPIIHNEKVIADLEEKGVRVIPSLSEAAALSEGTMILRSHGVSRAVQETIEKTGLTLVDATCPFVRKIHEIVAEYAEKGYFILIIGSADHPEVEGVVGWARPENSAVISTEEEVSRLDLTAHPSVCVVAQTTFHHKKFQDLVEMIRKKAYDNIGVATEDADFVVHDTICSATRERQEAARELSGKVDAMIVIGGASSSNTRKLFEICSANCCDTYFIQTKEDLEGTDFSRFDSVGITAGASTPKNIIEEVQKSMAENFEQMLDDYDKTIRNGEVVEGTVIDVKPEEIILNIGYKADGILTRSEYSNDNSLDLTTVVSPGDTMEVKILKVNDGEGQVLLTYKRLANERVSEQLQEAFEKEEVLTGTVSQVLDGGLSVVIDDTRIFIPASLVSDRYERDLTKYQDQEIQFILTEFNPRRRRVIGNRKVLLQAENARKQAELLARIHVGDVIEGTVKNITDFGAFIDLGGADGLLHISEMSWGRVDNPRRIYKVGQTVRVFIKDIRDTKIALSVKFPEENPWNEASEQFKPGTVIKGKVARMTDFGAFVELAPGVDALLHVSQISREHVDKPSDVLEIGQEIEAKIVDFNAAEHKISLSMKALIPASAPKAKPEKAEEPAAMPASEAGEAVTNLADLIGDAVAEEAAPAAEPAEEPAAEEPAEAPAAEEAVEEPVAEEPAAEEAVEEPVAEEPAAEEPAEEPVAEEPAAEEPAEEPVAEEPAAEEPAENTEE